MKKLLFIFILFPMILLGQNSNYVKTTRYKVATQTPLINPDITSAVQSKVFLDGFGRPIQFISHQKSTICLHPIL
jgi:hypothetical protein